MAGDIDLSPEIIRGFLLCSGFLDFDDQLDVRGPIHHVHQRQNNAHDEPEAGEGNEQTTHPILPAGPFGHMVASGGKN
jgi:hypothetical protein